MMRYVPNDKYTIAWFKLAECVAKGEKEKAFGVYRLLMHSFEDQAYAYQLEGDLLGAFQDQRAIEKYAHAAYLYTQNGRYKESATIYQELIFLDPQESQYIIRLTELFNRIKNKELVLKKINNLANLLIEKHMYNHIIHLINLFEFNSVPEQTRDIYQKIFFDCVKHNDEYIHEKEQLLNSLLTFFMKINQSQKLQEFLLTLQEINELWYKKAMTILNC